jgi:hypothetical protein
MPRASSPGNTQTLVSVREEQMTTICSETRPQQTRFVALAAMSARLPLRELDDKERKSRRATDLRFGPRDEAGGRPT